jgi:hypothetical protein
MEKGIHALPWKAKLYEAMPWNGPKENQAEFEFNACKAIKESIDRGIPVHYGSQEDGLIIGYAYNGRRWYCVHPYHKKGKEAFWHNEVEGFAGGKWPWSIVIWTEPKHPSECMPECDLMTGALEQAVEMWGAKERNDYFCGEAAYSHWLDWLKKVDSEEEDPKAGMRGNGCYYDVLAHSRRIAGKWLKEKAENYQGQAQEYLLAASSQYEKMHKVLTDRLDCIGDLALHPDCYDDWNSAMRQDQMKRLQLALDHDRAAIAEIEKALKNGLKEKN